MQRCLQFVKHLGHFNVEPTVLTVDADQATYPVRDASLLAEVPAGVRVIRTRTSEPFESYKKLTGRAVPYGGFANEGKPGPVQKVLRFVRGNLFIPDPRRGWNRHALAAVEQLLAAGEQFDAVLTSSPPHSTQLIGLELNAATACAGWPTCATPGPTFTTPRTCTARRPPPGSMRATSARFSRGQMPCS